ncbi:MAG TPA: lysophospholipid acyltransferase family protein [Nitriliruptorales bacterium]|nr:lysophospholipid acyltransferase family protein [Nitriliruptorales bacterium]
MGRLRWVGEPAYSIVIGAVVTTFRIMDWRVRVFGSENIPLQGPFVVASNHVGYLDFVVVGYAARERGRLVRFMAKQPIFDHAVAGPLMRAMKHIPVDRYGRAADALGESIERLRRGQGVGMFPEGTISPSFVPRAGKSGAARMAMAVDAPLIPAAVWGSQRLLTKWRQRNLQRGVVVDVHVGEPIGYGADDDPQEVTGWLMAAIGGLTKKAADIYPQEPAGPDDRWWLPAHLGGTAPTPEEAEERLSRQRAAERERRRADEQGT